MKIQHHIDIAAPVARVWQLTLDIESWPEHTPTMTSVERLATGPLVIGSQARVKQPGQRARVWTVSALEDEKLFAWSTKWLGMTMTGIHALATSGIGTANTLTVEIDGGLSSFLGALLRRPIEKAIAQENQGFKTAAEA